MSNCQVKEPLYIMLVGKEELGGWEDGIGKGVELLFKHYTL